MALAPFPRHLLHANVRKAVFLEHGCEKNHNAWMLDGLEKRGVDADAFGWASVQLDGGIARVVAKVDDGMKHARMPARPIVNKPRRIKSHDMK